MGVKESVLKDYGDGNLHCMKCGEMWNCYEVSLYYDHELEDYICTTCYFWLLIKITNRQFINVSSQYKDEEEARDGKDEEY